MESIAANLQRVRDRIRNVAERSGRDPASIKLMAVSKRIQPEKINEAIAAGIELIGENRIQEAREKFPLLQKVSRHLIGHLQTNKVKYIFDLFDMVHSVDSLELAGEINDRGAAKGKKSDVLVQVNVSGETAKFGIPPIEVIELVRQMSKMDFLSVKGLMTIPPYSDNPDNSRPFYRHLSEIKSNVEDENIENIAMEELSMGMSHDFEVAVEEGATIVRVGAAIFGERD